MERNLTRDEFAIEDGHIPVPADQLLDDLNALARVKRDFLDLCKQLKDFGAKQDDLDSAEELFEEAFYDRWSNLAEELGAREDEEVPILPRSASLQAHYDEQRRKRAKLCDVKAVLPLGEAP